MPSAPRSVPFDVLDAAANGGAATPASGYKLHRHRLTLPASYVQGGTALNLSAYIGSIWVALLMGGSGVSSTTTTTFTQSDYFAALSVTGTGTLSYRVYVRSTGAEVAAGTNLSTHALWLLAIGVPP